MLLAIYLQAVTLSWLLWCRWRDGLLHQLGWDAQKQLVKGGNGSLGCQDIQVQPLHFTSWYGWSFLAGFLSIDNDNEYEWTTLEFRCRVLSTQILLIEGWVGVNEGSEVLFWKKGGQLQCGGASKTTWRSRESEIQVVIFTWLCYIRNWARNSALHVIFSWGYCTLPCISRPLFQQVYTSNTPAL